MQSRGSGLTCHTCIWVEVCDSESVQRTKRIKSAPQLREGRPEEKEYDKYFYSLAKTEQDKMRALGCGPYAEMALPRHSFPVYENASGFGSHDPRKAADVTDEETWVTGERVSEILRDVLAMLGSSSDLSVQHHWELVKIVMQFPDAKTESELANDMMLTKQAISVRAKKILHRASLISPGLLDRVRMKPMPKDRQDYRAKCHTKNKKKGDNLKKHAKTP